MYLFFLIPLLTCIVAGYIFKYSADELAYLTGSVTLVCLILSLVLAPWQLQLFVLVIVTISTRRLLLLNDSRTQLEDKKE